MSSTNQGFFFAFSDPTQRPCIYAFIIELRKGPSKVKFLPFTLLLNNFSQSSTCNRRNGTRFSVWHLQPCTIDKTWGTCNLLFYIPSDNFSFMLNKPRLISIGLLANHVVPYCFLLFSRGDLVSLN